MYTFFKRMRPALKDQGIDFRAVCPFDEAAYEKSRFAGEEGVDYLNLPDDPKEQARALIHHIEQSSYQAVVILPGAYEVPSELPPYLPQHVRCLARVPMMTGGSYRPTIRHAGSWDAVVAVSHRVASDLVDREPTLKDRMHVIYNGVPLDAREPDWGKFRSGGDCNVVYAGRLTDLDKGVRLLPEILRRAWPKAPQLRLVIAGNGPERDYLEKRFKKYRLSHRVEFMGGLALEKADEVMRSSPLFILPSRFEGCPNALLEAMGYGCACIASRIRGSVEEIVEDNVSGVLCGVGDCDDFSDKLALLANDLTRAKDMGIAARRRIASVYTVKNAARAYAHIFLGLSQKQKVNGNSKKMEDFALPKISLAAHIRGHIPASIKSAIRTTLERMSIST